MSAPVPIERKRALGNPGKRPLPRVPAEAEAPSFEPPPPPPLLDQLGRELWARVWGASWQWLKVDVDVVVLERYCVLYSQWHTCSVVLAAEGYTTEGSTGQQVAHPLLAVQRQVEASLKSCETKLGLTPADRVGLGLAVLQGKAQKSKLERFMSGGGGSSE